MTKIHGIHIGRTNTSPLEGVQKKDSSATAPADSGQTQGDSVALSARARAMDRLWGLLESSGSDRLLQIKAMIDAGNYNPAADDVARKIIGLHSR